MERENEARQQKEERKNHSKIHRVMLSVFCPLDGFGDVVWSVFSFSLLISFSSFLSAVLLRYSLIVIPPRPHKENFFSPQSSLLLKVETALKYMRRGLHEDEDIIIM